MTTSPSRPLIAAMQGTLDGYTRDPQGEAAWVDSWADGLQLLPRVDAFVRGGGMFPDYEVFWAAIGEDPAAVSEWLGRDVYPREIEYARVAADTPHLVLSTTLADVTWPTARLVRDVDALRDFKAQPGEAVYAVGGPGLVRTLTDEGLLDELRLIVHPIVAGAGMALFAGLAQRQALELVSSERTTGGRVHLTYRVTAAALAHAQ
jgi:dihydrofolate reductase